jgi:hypothetical protein
MLTPEQRSEFEQTGLVRVPGAIAADDVGTMAAAVWEFLDERDGIRRDDPATWTRPRPRGFQRLEHAGMLAAIGSPAVRSSLDELMGEGCWKEPPRWGQMLVSFPAEGGWWVPHNMWHLDMPAAGSKAARRGVKIFAFLTPVEPRGGATLAVEGSHRVAHFVVDEASSAPALSSAEVRRILKRTQPWFRQLWTPELTPERERLCMDEGTKIGDAEVRVVELTGEPGDVILMDPTLLHCMAPHVAGGPRFVVTERVFATP